jgi:hypothetical protein
MAFTKKMMGKEVGAASVYAKPHTGSVAGVDLTNNGYPQTGIKTTGTKTRGNGAATKGVTARGPMA